MNMRLATALKYFVVGFSILTVVLLPMGQAQAVTSTPAIASTAPQEAWCDTALINWCVPINTLILGIPYLIGYLGGMLMTIAGMLVDNFLLVNTSILPDNFGVITAGFKTTLSIANLLFVIALIFIAF